jgi:hypothetical protein
LRSISELACAAELWIRAWKAGRDSVQTCLRSKRTATAPAGADRFVERWEKAALSSETQMTTRGSTFPAAFTTVIDGWDWGPIVQHVH